MDRVSVWDWPTRLFHWALVACIIGSYLSVEVFEDLDWHLRFGLTILGLLVFRLLWGLIGSTTARFASFVRGPRRVRAYAAAWWRGEAPAHTGHNPLGAVSVLAMLLLLAVQVGLGLFANDDIYWDGPLASHVAKETSDTLTELHELNFNLLLALIALHVLATLAYLKRGQNLITPMLTGRKRRQDTGEPAAERLRFAPAWAVAAAAAVAAASVYVVLQLG